MRRERATMCACGRTVCDRWGWKVLQYRGAVGFGAEFYCPHCATRVGKDDDGSWREVPDTAEHEGMMTRREVLELIVKRHQQYLEATNSVMRSEAWGAIGGLSQVLGWPPAPGLTVRSAAHELALLMDAEREDDSV